MKREVINERILLLQNGKEEELQSGSIFTSLGITGFIRILEDEHKQIDQSKGFFGHFNLEKTNHVAGNRYGLAKILRNGEYSDGVVKKLPLLSREGLYVVECTRAENNIGYDALTPDYFEYSLGTIQDVPSLQAAILKRYGPSRKDLSNEEILQKGIAFTLLKFV